MIKFKPTYLYIKQHSLTGILYSTCGWKSVKFGQGKGGGQKRKNNER